MKAIPTNGEESQRKWSRKRKEKLAHILRTVPKTFSIDLVKLTVGWRYADSLLENARVKRYLAKYHAEELSRLEKLLSEICHTGGLNVTKINN